MAWFGRRARAKSPLFEDRPHVISESPREEKKPPETPAADLAAHFYKGSRVIGKLLLHGAAEIDGHVSGDGKFGADLTQRIAISRIDRPGVRGIVFGERNSIISRRRRCRGGFSINRGIDA